MIELLSRPRVFVLALWVSSMFISGLLGGLLLNFEPSRVLIWLILTLLGPALVWGTALPADAEARHRPPSRFAAKSPPSPSVDDDRRLDQTRLRLLVRRDEPRIVGSALRLEPPRDGARYPNGIDRKPLVSGRSSSAGSSCTRSMRVRRRSGPPWRSRTRPVDAEGDSSRTPAGRASIRSRTTPRPRSTRPPALPPPCPSRRAGG